MLLIKTDFSGGESAEQGGGRALPEKKSRRSSTSDSVGGPLTIKYNTRVEK